MKLYGSHLCKDCPPAVEYLTDHQVDFTFYDISNNLSALRTFLRLREGNVAFDRARQNDQIGIPCLVTDEGKLFIGDAIYQLI